MRAVHLIIIVCVVVAAVGYYGWAQSVIAAERLAADQAQMTASTERICAEWGSLDFLVRLVFRVRLASVV